MSGEGSLTALERVLMLLAGIVAAGIICMSALAMLETTLARVDKLNQENLIWSCTNNGANEVCIPYIAG